MAPPGTIAAQHWFQNNAWGGNGGRPKHCGCGYARVLVRTIQTPFALRFGRTAEPEMCNRSPMCGPAATSCAALWGPPIFSRCTTPLQIAEHTRWVFSTARRGGRTPGRRYVPRPSVTDVRRIVTSLRPAGAPMVQRLRVVPHCVRSDTPQTNLFMPICADMRAVRTNTPKCILRHRHANHRSTYRCTNRPGPPLAAHCRPPPLCRGECGHGTHRALWLCPAACPCSHAPFPHRDNPASADRLSIPLTRPIGTSARCRVHAARQYNGHRRSPAKLGVVGRRRCSSEPPTPHAAQVFAPPGERARPAAALACPTPPPDACPTTRCCSRHSLCDPLAPVRGMPRPMAKSAPCLPLASEACLKLPIIMRLAYHRVAAMRGTAATLQQRLATVPGTRAPLSPLPQSGILRVQCEHSGAPRRTRFSGSHDLRVAWLAAAHAPAPCPIGNPTNSIREHTYHPNRPRNNSEVCRRALLWCGAARGFGGGPNPSFCVPAMLHPCVVRSVRKCQRRAARLDHPSVDAQRGFRHRRHAHVGGTTLPAPCCLAFQGKRRLSRPNGGVDPLAYLHTPHTPPTPAARSSPYTTALRPPVPRGFRSRAGSYPSFPQQPNPTSPPGKLPFRLAASPRCIVWLQIPLRLALHLCAGWQHPWSQQDRTRQLPSRARSAPLSPRSRPPLPVYS